MQIKISTHNSKMKTQNFYNLSGSIIIFLYFYIFFSSKISCFGLEEIRNTHIIYRYRMCHVYINITTKRSIHFYKIKKKKQQTVFLTTRKQFFFIIHQYIYISQFNVSIYYGTIYVYLCAFCASARFLILSCARNF